VEADTFLIVNGDTMTDAPTAEIWRAHEASGALVTLALVPNHDPLRYGGVRLASDGAVVGFSARGASAAGSFHFIGVQVAHRDAFAAVPPGEPANSIGGIYDALLSDRPGSIRGVVVDARFWDVGTVGDYWRTSWALAAAAGHAPTGRLPSSALVTRSIVWDDVEFGEGSAVDECIVTDGVHVPAGVSYRRTILIRASRGAVVATPFTPDE
jgi:NDP-sugar pyrophosphorylase family protein